MELSYRKGDVIQAFLDDEFQAFAHGCNCFKVMGAGVAAQVRARLPTLYQADRNFDSTPQYRLGRISTYLWSESKVGFNLYTQFRYGGNKEVDYQAIEKSLTRVRDSMIYLGLNTLGIPRIGCGLGGGEWSQVEFIIDQVFRNTDFTITVYDL